MSFEQPRDAGMPPAPMHGVQFQDANSMNGTAASSTHHNPFYVKDGDTPRIFTVSQVPHPPFEKLGNPGPLGLLSFAVTTFVLGLYQCGAGLPHSNPRGDVGPDAAIFGLAIFMGGMAQLIAGIMEFRVGNTFGTTVHISYGAFWLSYAMFHVPSLGMAAAYRGDERAISFAIGIYLILWCFLTFLFLLAALRTNIAIVSVFTTLVLAFLFLSIANFIATTHPDAAIAVNKTGGAISVVCAFLAFYAGSSGLMLPETTFIRFPLGKFKSPEDHPHTKV
ncbi:conserved hypothetical protein [Uncinocarpus reesii 1704]|uniref:Gpr1 family protein n=1 Tax=Uncinocarpus reesii (strain UAMH 1704) TaxID=336963 RepID=C4JNP5_UNCRE|nr:uncharacterized protein UREG_03043 [Uncinocarpus reesii 1704]EEP78198.1 conserved hypothetical protein [Uncinocarpus reesii 1704]